MSIRFNILRDIEGKSVNVTLILRGQVIIKKKIKIIIIIRRRNLGVYQK